MRSIGVIDYSYESEIALPQKYERHLDRVGTVTR